MYCNSYHVDQHTVPVCATWSSGSQMYSCKHSTSVIVRYRLVHTHSDYISLLSDDEKTSPTTCSPVHSPSPPLPSPISQNIYIIYNIHACVYILCAHVQCVVGHFSSPWNDPRVPVLPYSGKFS